MRITRAMLNDRVSRLNISLNRPRAAWTRNENAEQGKVNMVANVGHLMLSTYSPGDGWTRYTLSAIVGEGGGESNVSPTCNAQEMWAYLRGVWDVLDSEYTHRFDKAVQS